MLVGELEEMKDTHLIFDYFANQTWGNIIAPRTNRFYLHSDFVNRKLLKMEALHKKERQFKSEILALGGFQLFINDEETTT